MLTAVFEDRNQPDQAGTPRLPPFVARPRGEPARNAEADSDVSPLRPFLLTSGRTEPDDDLELEAQVRTIDSGLIAYQHLAFEQRDIVALCRTTMSVAEVSASLGLQIGVVRVLVADLMAAGYLVVSRPNSQLSQDLDLIERVIRGFEAIH